MTNQIPVGFTPAAKVTFKQWLDTVRLDKYTPATDSQVQAYWDNLTQLANWDLGNNLTLEVSRFDTKFGNPETYYVDASQVEFVNE